MEYSKSETSSGKYVVWNNEKILQFLQKVEESSSVLCLYFGNKDVGENIYEFESQEKCLEDLFEHFNQKYNSINDTKSNIGKNKVVIELTETLRDAVGREIITPPVEKGEFVEQAGVKVSKLRAVISSYLKIE